MPLWVVFGSLIIYLTCILISILILFSKERLLNCCAWIMDSRLGWVIERPSVTISSFSILKCSFLPIYILLSNVLLQCSISFLFSCILVLAQCHYLYFFILLIFCRSLVSFHLSLFQIHFKSINPF